MHNAPHISKLSFTVTVSEQTYQLPTRGTSAGSETLEKPSASETAPLALVRAFIDGVEPLVSRIERPFDAGLAILFATHAGEHDLYTCSCGVAGCAGLHEGVHVTLLEDTVQWAFPLGTYRARLHPSFLSEREDSLVVTFDKGQYLSALTDLEATLQALAKIHQHLQLAPSEPYDPPAETSFLATWERQSRRAKEYHRDNQMHVEVFADMVDLSLGFTTPIGDFCLSPIGLRRTIALDSRPKQSFDVTRARYVKAAKLMHALRDTPTAFFSSLNWAEVSERASLIGDESTLVDRNQDYSAPELPQEPSPEFLAAIRARWELRY
jgi:hypothetical protein